MSDKFQQKRRKIIHFLDFIVHECLVDDIFG
jgi:hypothetical protein